jgi:ribA/ribD-fused uncharacterized protein
MSPKGQVRFYAGGDEYGSFSNFAPYPIRLSGKTWPTSEHYFQAQKFRDEAYQARIRSTKSPMIAARLGRSRKQPIRPDWDRVKLRVMEEAVRAKFFQHESLRQLLIDTGDTEIVEHTERDSTWGDGGDGSGQNLLGKILMRVREDLRKDRSGDPA